MAQSRARTETEAASLACSYAGQPPIGNLATDTFLRARACRQFFASTRDTMLRQKWWSFAKGWERPAALAGESLGPLKIRYQMSAACVRVRYIDECEDEEWDIENADITDSLNVTSEQIVLVTNMTAPVVAITKRVENVKLWDPIFLDAFALELAAAIGPKMGRSAAWCVNKRAEARDLLETAAAIDSKEQSPQRHSQRPVGWILARRGIRHGR